MPDEPAAGAAPGHLSLEPKPELKLKLETTQAWLYATASVGTGAFYAFNNFVLPPILKAAGAPDLVTGLLASARSIEGVVIQPAVGGLSDRLQTRFGRRKPFMAVAVPLSAAFFIASVFTHDLTSLAATIVLFSVFFNIAVDPYTALLSDIAPLDQRGPLSGLATGVQLASSVALLLVVVVVASGGPGVPAWTYALVAAAMLLSFAVTVLGVHEPLQAESVGSQPRRRPAQLRFYVAALLRHPLALRYLGTLFVYQFGLNAILPYLVLFIVDDIHQTEQTAFALSAGLLVVTAAAAVGFGKLSERTGTRAILAAGWALLAASAVGGVLVTTLGQTIVVVVLAGVGNGAATAVSWPLLTALIPPEKTGVFAGLKAAAESVAIPLSVLVAAELFLPWLGYRGIFAMLAITIGVALLLLLRFVHVPPRQPSRLP